MKKNVDCIVIGYGPVGALLSIFLSKLGLSVAVIDKNLDVYPLPRAIHFDEEVMRIFQMVNLSKQISNISRIGTKGMHFVDAPLGRTPKEAAEGTLDAMIGASNDLFERIKPIVECWSGNIIHVGPVGAGHKMKLIMNFIAN